MKENVPKSLASHKNQSKNVIIILTTDSERLFQISNNFITSQIMILLSAHNPNKRVQHITKATLDGTQHMESTSIVIPSSPRSESIPMQIDINYEVEPHEAFGWADFPAVQDTYTPLYSTPPPPIAQEQEDDEHEWEDD